MDIADIRDCLRNIWLEILDLPAVADDEDFFDLGGNSLLIPRVQRRIQTTLGIHLKHVDLFRYPTLSALTTYLFNRQHQQS